MSKYKGKLIQVMRPGPNGPYMVIAKEDEAKDRGWEPVTVTEEPTAGIPADQLAEETKDTEGFWSRILGH